jgi:Tfp pilus assembly protein PilO
MARQIADEKDKAKNSQTLSAMPIQIKIKGAFPNLVRFLDHLQEYKQMINVSNVVIRQDRSYPLLNCEFVIRIYTLKTMEELKNK